MARKPREAKHHGVALVDKPAGVTSHDVVQQLRKNLGQRQIGHTGTLDPAATGLMICTAGKATRLGRFLEALDKEYVGVAYLGRSTDTYDAEGTTVAEMPVPELTTDDIEAAFAKLRGQLVQAVPIFSAVKVDGERLYAKARRGEQVELPKREVSIHELELLSFDGTSVSFRTSVSKGTYIRTLAVQLGDCLGLPAHLSALRRTRVGDHKVGSAFELNAFDSETPPLIDLNQALNQLPAFVLDERHLLSRRCLLEDRLDCPAQFENCEAAHSIDSTGKTH